MDKPGSQYAKWNKSDRERQMLHGITDMWNLKKKKKKRKLNHENSRMVVAWDWEGEKTRNRLVKKKKCKLLSVTRWMKSEILICNMVTSW